MFLSPMTQLPRHNVKVTVQGHGIWFKHILFVYLYTLYIEQHIKTYNNIQYANGIQ